MSVDSSWPAGPRTASLALLLAELQALTRNFVLPLYDGLLENADRSLFELAKQVPLAKQRAYLDAMRLVQTERARLASAFAAALEKHFEARPVPKLDLAAGAKLVLKHPYEVEALILRMDTATRVSGHYADLLTDLQHRVQRLAAETGISADSLSPAGFCDSFRDALVSLRLDPGLLRPLLQIFEQHVLLQLQPLYTQALERLSAYGFPAWASSATSMPESRPTAPAPTVPQLLDAATAAVLQKIAMGQPQGDANTQVARNRSEPAVPSRGADAALAEQLMQAARGVVQPDNPSALATAIRQRVLLVGRMFNEIIADPQFPSALAPLTDAFRFPVLKAALADPHFFSQPNHPVRTLVNEMASRAATTRLEGQAGLRDFEAWTAEAIGRPELQPRSVSERLQVLTPLSEMEVDGFLQQQSTHTQARRTMMMDRVRETIGRTLEHTSASHRIPPDVQPLLQLGWAPMMARCLLHEGVEGPAYKAGMELLHRILFALDPGSPNARTPQERASLRQALLDALSGMGMCPSRARELIAGLDEALDAFKGRDIPGIGAASPLGADASAAGEAAATPNSSALWAPDSALPSSTAAEPVPAAYGFTAPTQADSSSVSPGEHSRHGSPSAPVVPLPHDLPTPRRLLEQLLKLGAWFRVYDRNTDTTRWLKLASWFPHVQRVSFTEFDGTNALTVHVRDLLQDILLGRSDPIDIPPQMVVTLEAVRRYHEANGYGLPDDDSLVA